MFLDKICVLILRWAGWRSAGVAVPEPKCIIVGAPHTSGWDFVMSWIFYRSLGGRANVLIKKEFFVWPLGYLLRMMGGIPVDRSKGTNVVRQVIKLFNERERMHLAITPEGTRRLTKRWKAGFHTMARTANIPVYMVSFNWGRKEMTLWGKFELTDDAKADINRMKDFYREKGVQGKHPENFSTEHE
jgi:1-acyl-sn-glycerol-3-phosphate acyltransferase